MGTGRSLSGGEFVRQMWIMFEHRAVPEHHGRNDANTILSFEAVDASELSGICSVGNTDPHALLAFTLIPRSLLVFLGTCFVIAGFASMCRERDSFRRRGTDTSKLDKLMFKMGLFCLLYIFPAVTQILCDVYAFNTVKRWYPTTIACKRSGGVEGGHCHRPHLPQ
ncbi:Frizzled/Smoothened family membrane region, partial [Ancylostoma duodenale]